MVVERVDRVDDPRLEDYRNVPDPELLRRRGVFVAEGRLVVERLLDLIGRGYRVQSLLLNDASFASLEPRVSVIPDLTVYVTSTAQLSSIVGFNVHRGCLAIAERPQERNVSDVAAAGGVMLALEAVADADNVGSAFRNASAFGAASVVLSPTCCDPLYRKAIRTSMGAVLRVPYARARSWPGDLTGLKSAGFSVIALTPRAGAVTLRECPRLGADQKAVLVVGAEGEGLSADAEALADIRVRIPMQPGVDSLNLAAATAIALYHLTV